MSCICRIMGDSERIRFYELDHESNMRLIKPHFHNSKRPGYEARKTRRNAIEGKTDLIIRQTTHQKPAAYRRCGEGGRNEKGTSKPPRKDQRQNKNPEQTEVIFADGVAARTLREVHPLTPLCEKNWPKNTCIYFFNIFVKTLYT